VNGVEPFGKLVVNGLKYLGCTGKIFLTNPQARRAVSGPAAPKRSRPAFEQTQLRTESMAAGTSKRFDKLFAILLIRNASS
jgi:hypothetical protein